MKTKLHYLVLSLATAFSVGQVAKAQVRTTLAPVLIQFWDFNNTPPVGGNSGGATDDSLGTSTFPLVANYVASGLTAGHIIYSRPSKLFGSSGVRDSICDNGAGGAFYYDYSSSHYSYFTTDDSTADGGNMFIRARDPADSCEFYLYIPTTGYKNISMQYAISTSSSGSAQYNILSYSTDNGSTWKNLTTAMDTFNISGVYMPDTLQVLNPVTANSGWYPVQINFTSDTSVNNKAGFILRFRIAGSNSTESAHNDRYDNFAVWADTIGHKTSAGVGEISAQAAGYSIYPNPVENTVNIISSRYAGAKLITVYNVVGQIVSETQSSDLQTTLNTSSLNAGVYFIEIKEVATGNTYTTKIVKE